MQQLPEKFLQQAKVLLGNEVDDFVNSIENTPGVSIRLNPFKPVPIFADAMSISWSKWGRQLTKRPSFIADPLFHAGAYYVQEASSMFLEQVFRQIKSQTTGPLKVLDLCAAPGGKSTLLLSLLRDEDLLVANEIIKSRVNILEENMVRWGRSNVVISHNDPKDFKALNQYFDVIVVDAPCSGEGMFRKDKKAIDEWSEEHVKLCAVRQQRILADVLPSLKPGGFLVYSTCTFNTAENEDNVLWLMENFGFKTMPIEALPEITETNIWKDNELFAYRFYLHRVQGEGFFTACLQHNKTQTQTPVKIKETKLEKPTIAVLETIRPWLSQEAGNLDLLMHKQMVFACPAPLVQDIFFLRKQLNVRLSGLKVGEILKGKLIPEHQLALSVHLNKQQASIEVNRENALRFLKKEVFEVPQLTQGIYLITYQGLGLGWVKVMPNRMNNYLPVQWRILKPLNELLDGESII